MIKILFLLLIRICRPVVRIQDCQSCDPGSNPGRCIMNKKKIFLILSLILMLNMSFSCNDSITISSNNDILLIRAALIREGSYNVLQNDGLFYYAITDENVNIKVTNKSISFFSNNESVNWTNVLFTELSFLNDLNSSSLDTEEINFLSNNGCCGTYENGKLSNVCGEKFEVPKIINYSSLINIILPIVLIFLFLLYKNSKISIFYFFIGALAWFINLIISFFLLSLTSSITNKILFILLTSLIISISEFIVIYIFIIKLRKLRENSFVFALGFGFFQLLITYTLFLIILFLLNQPITFLNTFPRLFNGINSIFLIILLTTFIKKYFKNKKYVLLIFFLFFLINIIFKIINIFVSEGFFGELIKNILLIVILLVASKKIK